MGDEQNQNGTQDAPLPAAVVSPEEQLAMAKGENVLNTAANPALPAIPKDAELDAMSDQDLGELAKAYGLPATDRDADIAELKSRRDNGVALHTGAMEDYARDEFDPQNPREFDPTVVLLHLERDGVVVEGFIDPFSGAGCRDQLVKLQDELVKARSREDGAAPQHVKTTVGEAPDPNALKRQRAAERGHDIDPKTGRCRNCHNAEWWCLDGHPCVPRQDAVIEEPTEQEEHDHGEVEGGTA